MYIIITLIATLPPAPADLGIPPNNIPRVCTRDSLMMIYICFQVALQQGTTDGRVNGVVVTQGTSAGTEVANGISFSKSQTESQQTSVGSAETSNWSDSVSSGKTQSFSRQVGEAT